MIPATREEQKKEAFRLFEDGRYQESLQLCMLVLGTAKDQPVEVLAATNMFYVGKLEDAEVYFRDISQKMPDSSYVHSYLAKVLEARGDEGAIAEYATAVHLDPTNQDALRSYAEYLLSHRDFRGALPVLKRLVQLGRKESDARNLVRSLIEIGEPQEALATSRNLLGEQAQGHEHLDALLCSRQYRSAAEIALDTYRSTNDPVILRKYLAALAQYDLPASLDAYASHTTSATDCEILADYVLLLSASGNYDKALDICRQLLAHSNLPVHRLMACDLYAATGDTKKALEEYECLISDEIRTKNDLEMLGHIIGTYRKFLISNLPAPEALSRFLSVASKDVNIASLLETARLYEDVGNHSEARAWYYRAYRADFFAGGLEYARFLAARNEERECEKVMLYILNNVKRSSDLHRVVAAIVDERRPMYRMRRLMDHVIRRLEERRSSLNSDGLELLAISLLIAARHALEESDYAGCKRFCLQGIDVLPVHTKAVQLEDFLALVRSCKDRSIADRPIMDLPQVKRRGVQVPAALQIRDELDLDEQEQKIVEFLRSHKKATEIELRKALNTRRVVGIVNRLIQKAAAKNVTIIEKKGVGDDGEVYEYVGT
jgi:tetratricopeptide (TPR) repeat protein